MDLDRFSRDHASLIGIDEGENSKFIFDCTFLLRADRDANCRKVIRLFSDIPLASGSIENDHAHLERWRIFLRLRRKRRILFFLHLALILAGWKGNEGTGSIRES